jgi:glycosyltransferase involved in cell wall biosynthesis
MGLPPSVFEKGRVAIVHDWLTGMRGGEAILDVICEIFPQADLYTLLQTDFRMSPNILNGREVHHSYLQNLMAMPRFKNGYRSLLPLFPHAIESLDLSKYDLILSNTHCVAKGVQKKEGALHVAYVSTPMRYIWDMFEEYFGAGKSGKATEIAAKALRPFLQKWDVKSTEGVDHLLANSRFVQQRIKDFWNRESTVMHPFLDPAKFEDRFEDPRDYYLIVSAFAPYKRIDLAIEAFQRLDLPLVVIGSGQDAVKLRKLARGSANIRFLTGISSDALGEFYRKAKAFVFPGLEDFGITPLESMYNGRPVIAYGKGGLLDTVTPETGIFFQEQTVESLMAAVQLFEREGYRFKASDARARALEFTREKFKREYVEFLSAALKKHSGAF